MYRRNITTVLWALSLLLIAFVFYNAWLKPTFFAPSPIPPPTTGAPLPTATADSFTDLIQGTPLPEVPPTRLVPLGTAPLPQLGTIRDDLDRGYYKKVETALTGLSREKLTREPVRRYVAGLWNNLGVQQEKFGGIELSVKAFRKATAFDPANTTAHLNLTQAYWGLRDPAMTQEFLQRVIRLAPSDPFPHLALAEWLMEHRNMPGAAMHLKEAETGGRIDSRLQAYAQRLAAKIDQAPRPKESPLVLAKQSTPPRLPHATPPHSAPDTAHSSASSSVRGSASVRVEQPTPVPSSPTTTSAPPAQPGPGQTGKHFVVVFQGAEDPDTWARIQAILEYAYQDICQKFGHEPTAPITVVLHTASPFNGNMDTPTWADSLFEQATGSIHVPTRGAIEDLGLLSRLLRHQFVHAVVRQKMGSQHEAVPAWLLEGLAVQLSEDPWPHIEEAKSKDVTVVPLISGQTEWKNLTAESLPVAYLEAQAATQSLIERYSMYDIRQILNLIRSGQPFQAAVQQKLTLSHEQFQRHWTNSLQATLKASRQ